LNIYLAPLQGIYSEVPKMDLFSGAMLLFSGVMLLFSGMRL